jgi:hypothetical protein
MQTASLKMPDKGGDKNQGIGAKIFRLQLTQQAQALTGFPVPIN